MKAIGDDKIVTTGGNIVSAATVRNDTISQFGDRKVVDERRDSLSGGVNTTLGVLIGAGIAKKKKTPEAEKGEDLRPLTQQQRDNIEATRVRNTGVDFSLVTDRLELVDLDRLPLNSSIHN